MQLKVIALQSSAHSKIMRTSMRRMRHFMVLMFLWAGNLAAQSLSPSCGCGLPEKLNYYLDCFAEEEQHKEGLELVAKNGEWGECGLERILLLFDYYGILDIEHGRRLMLAVVDDFLKAINEAKGVGACFVNFPLTTKDIEVRIRTRQRDCGFVYPYLGNVAFILFSDDILTYGTMNSYSYTLETLSREPYDIAHRLAKNSEIIENLNKR